MKAHPTMPCPTEREESMSIMAWARIMFETGQEPRLALLRCGFEGLRLSMGLRMQVKKQSISTGWPDFFLSVPSFIHAEHDYYGLYIELKRIKGGIVSTEQRMMHDELIAQGYCVKVCRGAQHAINEIKRYLGTEAT
jgi:hypothetical protein